MEKKKRHLNKKKVFILFSIIFIIIITTYYFVNLRVKRVFISGNTYVKDATILRNTNLYSYPLYRDINTKDIKNILSEISIISDVKIKKYINGTVKIIIEEERPLLFLSDTSKIVTDKNNVYDYDTNLNLSLPTLKIDIDTNYRDLLVKALVKLDTSVYDYISEIEYSPTLSIDGDIIDDKRFTFYMKDGNIAYINTINIDKFNYYLEVVNKTNSTYGSIVNGTYSFDSGTSNALFSIGDSSSNETDTDS